MAKQNLNEEKKSILASSKVIRETISNVLDENSFVEIGAFSFASCDEINNSSAEGVITGYGLVDGIPVYLFAQNGEVLSGGFSKKHADKIHNLYEKAFSTKTPIIAILDSLGARMAEGIGLLEGYAKLLSDASKFSGVAPQICLVKGNACGLVSSFASLCDVTFMLDGSVLGTVSPSVISGKANSKLSGDKLIGASNCELNGLNSKTVKKADLKNVVSKYLEYTVTLDEAYIEDENGKDISLKLSSNDIVKAVLDNNDLLSLNDNYGKEVFTSIGKLAGITVGVSYVEGKLTVDGLKKLARFVQFLDCNNMPYISFVNSDGLVVCLKAEQNGLSKEFAKLVYVLNNSSNIKISVITGKACGASYVGLVSKESNFDNVVAWEDAVISPIATDTAVEIYFADQLAKVEKKDALREKLAKQFESENANVLNAANEGYIDNIIEPEYTRNYLISMLQMLSSKDIDSGIIGNMPL